MSCGITGFSLENSYDCNVQWGKLEFDHPTDEYLQSNGGKHFPCKRVLTV